MDALLRLRPGTVYALRLALVSLAKRSALDKRRGEMLRAIAMGLGYEVPSYADAVDRLFAYNPAETRDGRAILQRLARDMDEIIAGKEEEAHGA